MSEEKQWDYENLTEKMELRFDQVHRRYVHQVEFKHLNEKSNESLQE